MQSNINFLNFNNGSFFNTTFFIVKLAMNFKLILLLAFSVIMLKFACGDTEDVLQTCSDCIAECNNDKQFVPCYNSQVSQSNMLELMIKIITHVGHFSVRNLVLNYRTVWIKSSNVSILWPMGRSY